MLPLVTLRSSFDQQGEPVAVDSSLARFDISVEEIPGLPIAVAARRRGQADSVFIFDFGPGAWRRNATRHGELIAAFGKALAANGAPYFDAKEREQVLTATLAACGWERRTR